MEEGQFENHLSEITYTSVYESWLKRQCLVNATLPSPRKSSLLFPMAPTTPMKSMKKTVKSSSRCGIAGAGAAETERFGKMWRPRRP